MALQQNKHAQWNWKFKCYPVVMHKENRRGQGQKTKKMHKKMKDHVFEVSTRVCPFEAWRRKTYTDYMAVEYALGYKPLCFNEWCDKIKKDHHRLISIQVSLYGKEHPNELKNIHN